jgi:hypothetical protein
MPRQRAKSVAQKTVSKKQRAKSVAQKTVSKKHRSKSCVQKKLHAKGSLQPAARRQRGAFEKKPGRRKNCFSPP